MTFSQATELAQLEEVADYSAHYGHTSESEVPGRAGPFATRIYNDEAQDGADAR
jgi:hypothetical protein